MNYQLTLAIAILLTSAIPVLAEEDITKKEPFYINNMTITLQMPIDDDDAIGVTPIYEGVWAREYPDGFQFWTYQGLPFTDSRWTLPGVSRVPKMTKWGMIVKKAGTSSDAPYTLITSTGSEIQCPAGWMYPTEFVDSLAIVAIKEGWKVNYRYITPNLKIAFPHLSPKPEIFEGKNNTTPPLSEGLRAYCTNVDGRSLWGYIDGQGRIVIDPQFTAARSFHCGRALVKDKNGKKFFIDITGKMVYEPMWDSYDDISDYDSNICSGPGARFDQTNYYDLHGQLIGTLKCGSPFHNGYAYCKVFNEEQNRDLVHRVGKGLDILEPIAVTSSDFNPPTYDELGIPHFTSSMVDGGPCNGMYFFDYTIGPFSKEGLAPAVMTTNDGSKTYYGFVDREGHYVFLYRVRTKD